MIIQVFVFLLACAAASMMALIIAGVSLAVFGKFLERAEQEGKPKI